MTSEEWAQSHTYNMYILIFSCITITSASILILTITPLNTGVVILFIALTLALVYSSLVSSWIAFLIFLIYIGGILVIFAYFVALSPNQKRNVSIFIPFTLTTLTLLLVTINNNIPTPVLLYKSINTFYLLNNIPTLIILALILLFTIVVVVKLVTNNKGPLRPFKLYV